MSKQSYNSIFLSPHLDDVVLSCALRLLREQEKGNDVLVATLFSKGFPLIPGIDFYENRRNEDKQALNALGIKNFQWLGFHDAPFRNLYYHNFQRIILGEHPSDLSFANKVADKVLSLCKEYSVQTVFVPLAVGTHIDHRLTHQVWSKLLLSSRINLIFYEDRPYIFLPHSLKIRFIELGMYTTQPEILNDDQISFAEGLDKVIFYKNVLKNKDERHRYISSAENILNKMLPESKPQLKAEAEIVTTKNKEEVAMIEKAIGLYKSQMKMLYGNMKTFRKESADYNSKLDSSSLYAERYWKLIY